MFLSQPNERRLWQVIAGVLGVTGILLIASLQFPWFTSSYFVGTAEYRGSFDFEEGRLVLFSNDVEGEDWVLPYADDGPFAEVMGRAELLIGLGVAGVAAFGGLLALYYYGRLQSTRWIKVAWAVGFVSLVFGITYFALTAGGAGADEIYALLQESDRVDAGTFGAPEPTFWGEQNYANGDLVSSPGIGWLLAILATVNFVLGTLLLYQFPDRAGSEEGYEAPAEKPAMESTEFEPAYGSRT